MSISYPADRVHLCLQLPGRPVGTMFLRSSIPTAAPRPRPLQLQHLPLPPARVVGEVQHILVGGREVLPHGHILGVLEEPLARPILNQAVGKHGAPGPLARPDR